MSEKILLVGCGNMGKAILEGWLERGLYASDISIIEPNLKLIENFGENFLTNCFSSPEKLPTKFNPRVIFFAVKPQLMNDIVPFYSKFNSSHSVFISIAAGKTIEFFENHLTNTASIIRAMPNTPASVRRGITVAFSNSKVTDSDRDMAHNLLKAIGAVEWVNEEALIDSVTALSGGGPAYVFLLTECLARAGIESGLPSDLSTKLARATISGSGELLYQSSESPSTLRKNVTSPGGTTEKALQVLMENDEWQSIISRAIAAATARSKELAG